MYVNGERTYLFNPYQIKIWSDEQIKEQVNDLIGKYDANADTMYQMALNVDILSDLLYIYGEMVARITESYELKKLDNDIKENKEIYRQRQNYKDTNDKAPAIKYFEAIASEIVKDDRKVEMQLKADLTRFKRAYESIETKANAIKKKMEAVKYENC